MKFQNGLWIAFILQIGLFTNASLIEISARLIPESTMIIPVILLSVLLIKYIKKDAEENNYKRITWQFSAIVAFGIACKLSFTPMLLIPLILFRKNLKAILQLVWKTILLTCLFAYPIITNPSESFEWISNIFLHSGKHGTGASDFINTNEFSTNIGIIIKRDAWFWVLLLGQFALSFTSKNKRLKEASLAITISLMAILFFTLKHFAIHYIMPFYAFKTLFVVFIIFALQENKKLKAITKLNQKIRIAAAILIIVLISPQLIEAKNHYDYSTKRKEKENTIQKKVLSQVLNNELPLIVDAPYWGTPFPEYAKAYGFMNTHRRKTTFKDELRELHPNFYCYVPWSENFNHWDKFVGFDYILKDSKACYLYTNQNIGSTKRIIERLNNSKIKYELFLLYENRDTGESLFVIDTSNKEIQ